MYKIWNGDYMAKKYRYINKDEINKILHILDYSYIDAHGGLDFNNPLQLTVALILAAQCTDKMVNMITPILFDKYKDVTELSKANIQDIQAIIKPCGFYITKSKNIINMAKKIVNEFNMIIPKTMNELCSLPGIGRKSANIILQECFNIVEGIAVDTHVTRLSYRMGLSKQNSQEKIEEELMEKIDNSYYNKINHIFVYHGRAICSARNKKCEICMINDICPKNEYVKR